MTDKTTTSCYHEDILSTGDCIDLLTANASLDSQQLATRTNDLFTAAHARLQRSASLGASTCIISESPTAGSLPFAIKDNTDVAGYPTTHGSTAFVPVIASRTAAIVNEFRVTGFEAIAKTDLPEFGLTATTEHSVGEDGYRAVRNPWHHDRMAGGSSGGSAALVAAGVVPAAHANDGGGSIRIPAACCGLTGLKPSVGRLTLPAMAKALPLQIVTEGVLTRTVRDSALIYAALESGCSAQSLLQQNGPPPIAQSGMSAELRLPMIGYVTSPPEKRLRIAMFTRRPDGSQPDIECVESVNGVASDLRRLGHRVSHIENPASEQFGQSFLLYWSMLAASLRLAGLPAIQRFGNNRNSLQLQAFDPRLLEPMTRQLGRHFTLGFWRLPATLRLLRRAAQSYRTVFKEYEAVLCPTLGTTVPSIGHLAPNLDFRELEPRLRDFASFTPLDNVAGTPALSLPIGFDDRGLPLGVQLSGDQGTEATLLALGLELEQASLLSTGAQPHATLS